MSLVKRIKSRKFMEATVAGCAMVAFANGLVKPEELALTGVYDYVSYLKESKQDSARYELAFWRKALQPISIAVMMLLA